MRSCMCASKVTRISESESAGSQEENKKGYALICDAIGLAALIHFLIPVVSLVPVVIDDLDGSLTLDGVEGGGAVHVAYANRADGAGVLGSRGGAPCSERVGEPGQWVVQQICLKVVRAQVVQGSDEQWTDLLVAGSYGKDCVWSCPVC